MSTIATATPVPWDAFDHDWAAKNLYFDAPLDAGHFPEGSMGPKIEAAIGFLREGGRSVTITDADHLAAALRGRDGTTLTRTGRAPKEADA